MAKVVIIDDEASILELMSQVCRSLGHEVHARQTGAEGLQTLGQLKPELLIVDLHIGDVNGLEIIQQCRSTSPQTAIIMVTGHSSVETAVEAMRLGAFDYIAKPFELTDLKLTIEHALGQQPAPPLPSTSSSSNPPSSRPPQLVGESAAIQKISSLIQRVADTDSPVLLEGEFGVGKQLIARVLHQSSRRHAAPFKAIQCSALSADLLEAELFGHDQSHNSIFTRTRGGTVHLAEIHHMPMHIQAQLNAYLDQATESGASFRLITSTSQHLDEAIRNGQFREDLYYKISVVPVHIPPLRERREDIALLIQNILREQALRSGSPMKRIEPYASEFLQKYPWPGNISELRNAVERACAMSENDTIQPADLPAKVTQKSDTSAATASSNHEPISLPIGSTLDSFVRVQEKLFINETLKYNNGSREKTASMLGVSIATLYRKMELNVERRTTS
ncbi:sigma-54-dependent Fis family transcriptional regulator [Phragmitibacter flavus]|uniref:Sigma-54-dependent Fis family transcriptional regulator n=1 Tax=Phragmitibacter flavus TaxID=2576071 RepID=A0A5R8KBA1_9BACT|nr:sigma-54 dependent transcriptional regulator [Phragmitibacter flavus]TLD69576.1 sigma-54-dependent Fis family transcriptional regulator [Phragmitibacter flavus]